MFISSGSVPRIPFGSSKFCTQFMESGVILRYQILIMDYNSIDDFSTYSTKIRIHAERKFVPKYLLVCVLYCFICRIWSKVLQVMMLGIVSGQALLFWCEDFNILCCMVGILWERPILAILTSWLSWCICQYRANLLCIIWSTFPLCLWGNNSLEISPIHYPSYVEIHVLLVVTTLSVHTLSCYYYTQYLQSVILEIVMKIEMTNP